MSALTRDKEKLPTDGQPYELPDQGLLLFATHVDLQTDAMVMWTAGPG